VIVIDEIGTMAEALAARTIAERGVQLVGTAHGNTLDNLVINPTLSDLIGGIQPVTLSDEEARRRGTQKTVLERKARPSFDMLVEIQTRDRLAIYKELSSVVDRLLGGVKIRPEIRVRASDGSVVVESGLPTQGSFDQFKRRPKRSRTIGEASNRISEGRDPFVKSVRIYPIGVNRTRLERAIRELGVPARLADQPVNAQVILSLKAQRKRQPKKLFQALDQGVEFYMVKSNTLVQVKNFLRSYFKIRGVDGLNEDEERTIALEEAEDAVVKVQRGSDPVELGPRNSFVRRSQHLLIQGHGLQSRSRGQSPNRRVVVFPQEN